MAQQEERKKAVGPTKGSALLNRRQRVIDLTCEIFEGMPIWKYHQKPFIVVNHTLFFALLNTDALDGDENTPRGPGGFLFPNDFAILDEAHTIEQVAAVQLGLRLSQSGLRFDLHRLYHPRTRKGLLKSFRKASALLAVDQALLAAAPAIGGAGGAAGALSQVTGTSGAGGLANAASAFSKLGLKPDSVGKAVPVLTSFVTKSGGADVGKLLAGALK